MAKSYQSPMGDIKAALRKVAGDSNDPNHEAAKAALRALGDEDDAEATDDDEQRVKDAVSAHPAARAKALVNAPKATYLSTYAAQLDAEMGLSARQGTRVEGDRLILSAAKPWGPK